MGLNREIEALKKRLTRIAPIAAPPKLSMNVIQEGSGDLPIESPWVLNLLVESKPTKPPLIEKPPIQEDIKQKH